MKSDKSGSPGHQDVLKFKPHIYSSQSEFVVFVGFVEFVEFVEFIELFGLIELIRFIVDS